MKIKIIFALAAIALCASLNGCMSADDQAEWQNQKQISDAERAQNQAQIQADRLQRETERQNGQ